MCSKNGFKIEDPLTVKHAIIDTYGAQSGSLAWSLLKTTARAQIAGIVARSLVVPENVVRFRFHCTVSANVFERV